MVNTTSKLILEIFESFLGNFVRIYNIKYTYTDKYGPWMDILAAASFVIISTEGRLKGYTMGQFTLFPDMILAIQHTELILQKKN